MEQTREAFDRLTAAVNAHDLQAVAGCYSPDAVLTTPEGTCRGREEIGAYWEQFLGSLPDVEGTIETKLTSGKIAADEWSFTGTNSGPLPLPSGETLPPTGKRVTGRGADFATIEGGAITAHRIYYDQMALMQQLGLLSEEG